VNYETRIAALKAKGILGDKEAEQLKNSVQNRVASLPKQRTFSLEIAGVVLIGMILLYIGIQVGTTGAAGGVEDVAQTLNNTRAGVGAGSTFSFLLLAAGVGGFLLFYLLVHRYYNRIWKHQEQMQALGEMISDLEVRKKRLADAVEKILAEGSSRENTQLILGRTDKTEAMYILEETEASLGELQEQYAALKAVCRYEREKFPYTLAALAGSLPACE